ncbi:hypothetical protein P8452_14097 [Trifolium repens]|nr:hypothetical protein P8452_14097 [Trifolium repens]
MNIYSDGWQRENEEKFQRKRKNKFAIIFVLNPQSDSFASVKSPSSFSRCLRPTRLIREISSPHIERELGKCCELLCWMDSYKVPRLAFKVSCLQGKRTQKLSSWCFSSLRLRLLFSHTTLTLADTLTTVKANSMSFCPSVMGRNNLLILLLFLFYGFKDHDSKVADKKSFWHQPLEQVAGRRYLDFPLIMKSV